MCMVSWASFSTLCHSCTAPLRIRVNAVWHCYWLEPVCMSPRRTVRGCLLVGPPQCARRACDYVSVEALMCSRVHRVYLCICLRVSLCLSLRVCVCVCDWCKRTPKILVCLTTAIYHQTQEENRRESLPLEGRRGAHFGLISQPLHVWWRHWGHSGGSRLLTGLLQKREWVVQQPRTLLPSSRLPRGGSKCSCPVSLRRLGLR